MTEPLLHSDRRGAGPLAVLLHPVGLDGTFWGALPDRLARTHTVVAIDMPGHGRSGPAARPGRMDACVAAVAAVIEAERAGPAVVIGLSFGGMVAQNLALARPDLVAALIPSGCGGRIPETARPAILARGTDAETGGMAAVVEGTIERWFTPGFRATAAAEAVRRRLLADDPSGWSAAWEAISGHDALDRLGAVQMPALVIGGEADAATPVEAARALAAAIPGAELAILPGAPHMMQIESPDLYAAAIEGFLARRGL
ncbi:hypothetical protein ABB55_04320 [Prosthecomicrobium hirschii]|uniref:AB hydrolase-1 domain-containing protein n=1 Tax=Prosthecodimorpha hirschii TaxID=665126 RepID=A0A0P6W0V5_9HYPH|nr:alpha/beta fold hydrolase [Prosthecomicrobium hirschii]KPL51552.1 hypothetical protein ABB55_04320 [Prosthecomicrobium hirschii]